MEQDISIQYFSLFMNVVQDTEVQEARYYKHILQLPPENKLWHRAPLFEIARAPI